MKQPSTPRAPQDPLAIRTVFISGLPADITKQVLWKKVRKVAGAEDVEILEDATSGLHQPLLFAYHDRLTHDIAKALFDSPASASAAVSKLHAHVYKGAMLSAVLKKRADASIAVTSAKPKAASRASRLIVRNLPWDAGEQDLRALFLPFGPIHSVHVPSEVETGRGRGFAFVWMLSKADAAKALEGVNGTKVRGGLAARITEDKQKRKKDARLERKKEGGEGEGVEEEAAAKERVVAVDWALSKDRWQEEKTKLDKEGGQDAEMDEASGSGSSASSDEDDEDREDGLGVDDDEASDQDAGSDDEDDEDGRDDDDAPIKPLLPQTDVGTTLFVRNVPYEASEDDLRQL